MIVESKNDLYEWDGFGGRINACGVYEENSDIAFELLTPGSLPLSQSSNLFVSDEIKVRAQHKALTHAFLQHVWDHHGIMDGHS